MMSAIPVKIRVMIAAAKKRLRATALPTTRANYSLEDFLGAESVL